MNAVGIIPARWEASRLPGKPLAEIAGRPMIQHVYERACRAASLAQVIVATDDARILAAVQAFGGEVVLTSATHRSGTDRVAEAAGPLAADVVVNIQGDEPLIDPEAIDSLVAPFESEPSLCMTTLAVPIRSAEEIEDPSVVKVVIDRQGYALYFSRYPIPFYRDEGRGTRDENGGGTLLSPLHPFTPSPLHPLRLKHIGLYAYRADFLQAFSRMQPTALEQAERLEQLRALESGERIFVVLIEHDAVSVDTPEDLARVRAIMEAGHA
jgi:3-deoxy-manno-octulosonate cytidylyltransferase (CMP-KDO synthetase)